MKLKDAKNSEVTTIGSFGEVNATISAQNEGFVFDLVSKGMYKDPISSMIRELTSNCFDAHVAAGNLDEPVIISIDGNEIRFIDKGVGMSPEFFKDVYFSWFSSTKRDSDDYIGAFGLGSKSPFSYTDEYKVVTIKDGVKYTYLLESLGDKGKPTYSLLTSTDVNEPNGTTVVVVMKEEDYYKFDEKLKNQLAYFTNVYVDVKNNWRINYDNDYNIYENDFKNFKYRTNCPFSVIHICIDKVYYPIDFAQLDLSSNFKQSYRHKLPIALKFNIGDLMVTPERESIRYTNESIELITNKLKEAYKELVSHVRKESYCDDLMEVIKHYDKYHSRLRRRNYSTDKLVKLKDEVELLFEHGNYAYDEITEKLYTPFKDFDFINYSLLLNLYSVYGHIDEFGTLKRLTTKRTNKVLTFARVEKTSLYKQQNLQNESLNGDIIYRLPSNKDSNTVINRIKNLYIRDKEGLNISHNRRIDLIKVRKLKYREYEQIFKLPSQKKLPYGWSKTKIIRLVVNECHKSLLKYTESYAKLDTGDFKTVLKKRQTEFNKINAIIDEVYYNQYDRTPILKNVKLDKNYVEGAQLIIYGNRNHSSLLYGVYTILQLKYTEVLNKSKYIKVIKIKSTMFKQFKELKNAIHVNDFIDSDDTKIGRSIVSVAIIQLILENIKVSKSLVTLTDLLPDTIKKINKIKRKIRYDSNYRKASRILENSSLSEVFKPMIANYIASGNISEDAKYLIKFREFVYKHPLLHNITYNEDTIVYIADYLKSNGVRLDHIWYSDLKYAWEKELFEDIKSKLVYLESVGKRKNLLKYFI